MKSNLIAWRLSRVSHACRYGGFAREIGLPTEMSEPPAFPTPTPTDALPEAQPHYIQLAAEIVSAYVSHNSVPAADLAQLLNEVHDALRNVDGRVAIVVAPPPKPAVPAKRSVTEEYIICLEDGRRFKSLKRHLRTKYDMSPEAYREKWGLAADYPMVAPSYAKARSHLAKEMGLEQQRRRRA